MPEWLFYYTVGGGNPSCDCDGAPVIPWALPILQLVHHYAYFAAHHLRNKVASTHRIITFFFFFFLRTQEAEKLWLF